MQDPADGCVDPLPHLFARDGLVCITAIPSGRVEFFVPARRCAAIDLVEDLLPLLDPGSGSGIFPVRDFRDKIDREPVIPVRRAMQDDGTAFNAGALVDDRLDLPEFNAIPPHLHLPVSPSYIDEFPLLQITCRVAGSIPPRSWDQ